MILGAGYGGLVTAIKLEENAKDLEDVEIVLVDRNDYHQYLHLSYEIVTNVKKVSDLTIPLSELLGKRKIRFFQATVREIGFANKVVRTNRGDLPYDELVIALGSEPNYFNIRGAKEHSFCVSSVEDAARIRDELRKVFARDKDAKIVVGGGGFTGVELTGEIVDEFKSCVTVVEASNTLLQSWDIPEFSSKVARLLTEMGAKLILGRRIVEVKSDAVVLEDGSQIESSLFIWAGGVQGCRVTSASGLKTGKDNRVIINEYCEAVSFPGVYVIGDSALVVDSKTGEALPQCIEITLQQADVVARNLFADVAGGERTVFVPKFGGLILTVGEGYGIGRIFGVDVEGRLAQMVKRIIHLRYVYQITGLVKVLKDIF
ncbi:FAD-dependent oxidoreductase [Candidatus Bathyarchaeota archaeon]|nr:FAD-dependent oxidoreductase [Candidatus Bathyarchaeota archaeon]